MLLSEVFNDTTGFDIGTLSMDGDRELKHLLTEEFIEAGALVSPDGRSNRWTSAPGLPNPPCTSSPGFFRSKLK